MELGGLHHVTAVTGNASRNVSFYTHVLGLRLVKRTVNQDDVSAYHLFYADEAGTPGTEVTFFEWPHIGPNVPGTGAVGSIGLRVPSRRALEWWAERLDGLGVQHGDLHDRGGRGTLALADPEGQRLELIEDGGKPGGTPWKAAPVPVEMAIRGLDSVTLVVDSLAPTEATLTEVLGFRRAGSHAFPEDGSREVVVFETGPGGAGAEVHVEERPELPSSRLGIGGVHHVAFRTPSDEEHRQWRDRVARARLGVTPVIDRFYFRSIYFREPGGVLFEIATDGPGFATDEAPEHLGESLALPPFLEPYRAQIEAGLRPISPEPVAGAR
ncbi:MAG: ring-cleaving dioxygenase [Chloroflexota bacterium]|nr:ring-cleaving dioxygenase [Chloroflexota bacterium]